MSSSEEEENPLVRFGTALAEQEDDEPAKKPVAMHEQIVTDSEGRRRFHGAFTGGFSAGYYNTVDTKDGWTPTTFRSSRKDRGKNKAFEPEDFMDEEDMSEFGIAPKQIVTQKAFTANKTASKAGAKRNFERNATMLLGMDMLQALIIPVSNNVGVKLLQKMGWKPGQGIGPKVKRRKKNEYIPANVTFAPEDTVPMNFSPKENMHGIGYTGMDPTLALHNKHKKSSALTLRTKSGAKLSFAGQAFGVGAYEDEDQDIYAQDSMANYDLVMGEEKQDDAYGWSRPTKAITGPSDVQSIAFVKKVLTGFKKAERSARRRIYPPPILPPDFDPNKRLKLLQLGEGTQQPEQQPSEQKSKYERLDPDQRRDLVEGGELKPPIDDKPKSVFDLMSPRDRVRFEKLRSGADHVAKEESKGHKKTFYEPFASNPAKQARYQRYLTVLKERKIDPYSHIEHDPHMTEWEKQQEQEEFTKSSRFFQPLSATMSSRFAPESRELKEQDEKEKALKNAAKLKQFGIMTRESFEWHPDHLLCKRFNVPNPYPNSDVVGVPGHGSEEKELFLDPSDFIKRKPIKPPSDQKFLTDELLSRGKIVSDTKNPQTFVTRAPSKSNRWDEKPAVQGPVPKDEVVSSALLPMHEGLTDDMTPVSQEEGETANNVNTNELDSTEPQNEQRPSMDLFKAIFASSDEEFSEEDDCNGEDETSLEPAGSHHPQSQVEIGVIGTSNMEALECVVDSSNDFALKTKPGYHKFSLKPKQEQVIPLGAEGSQGLDSDTTDADALGLALPLKHGNVTGAGNMEKVEAEDTFGPALPPPAKLSRLWKTIDPEQLIGKKKAKKKHKHKKEKAKKKRHR